MNNSYRTTGYRLVNAYRSKGKNRGKRVKTMLKTFSKVVHLKGRRFLEDGTNNWYAQRKGA